MQSTLKTFYGLVGSMWLAALLVIGALVFTPPAHGQVPQAGELTLGMTQTTRADGKLDVSLLWNTTPDATRCVATGGWSGTRSADRATPVIVTAVTPPKNFTLTCYWDDKDATITWVAPTQNADGSPLTDLKGFRIYYGNSPTTITTMLPVDSAVATTMVINGLAAGVWHFNMTALNVKNEESVRSASVSTTLGSADVVKTVTATASQPKPPTGLVATP